MENPCGEFLLKKQRLYERLEKLRLTTGNDYKKFDYMKCDCKKGKFQATTRTRTVTPPNVHVQIVIVDR